jgi:hypothetical protein
MIRSRSTGVEYHFLSFLCNRDMAIVVKVPGITLCGIARIYAFILKRLVALFSSTAFI